jgi:hypothetical protein
LALVGFLALVDLLALRLTGNRIYFAMRCLRQAQAAPSFWYSTGNRLTGYPAPWLTDHQSSPAYTLPSTSSGSVGVLVFNR